MDLSTYECRKCHATRPVEDFPRDKSRKLGFYPYCRPCNTKHVKDYYTENSAAIAEKRRERVAYQREWYARVRAISVEIYGGCCTACGDDEKLEFDHVNYDGEEHRLTESVAQVCARIARTGERIEDYQLQLLCQLCHKEKHRGHHMKEAA